MHHAVPKQRDIRRHCAALRPRNLTLLEPAAQPRKLVPCEAQLHQVPFASIEVRWVHQHAGRNDVSSTQKVLATGALRDLVGQPLQHAQRPAEGFLASALARLHPVQDQGALERSELLQCCGPAGGRNFGAKHESPMRGQVSHNRRTAHALPVAVARVDHLDRAENARHRVSDLFAVQRRRARRPPEVLSESQRDLRLDEAQVELVRGKAGSFTVRHVPSP
mmetsp:Transcript_22311/g.63439  ORF Transcript_22311/g.63439 Transcript_22311/m.63439 type:complete len:221 (+) Transcript_22311:74-736(+)